MFQRPSSYKPHMKYNQRQRHRIQKTVPRKVMIYKLTIYIYKILHLPSGFMKGFLFLIVNSYFLQFARGRALDKSNFVQSKYFSPKHVIIFSFSNENKQYFNSLSDQLYSTCFCTFICAYRFVLTLSSQRPVTLEPSYSIQSIQRGLEQCTSVVKQ